MLIIRKIVTKIGDAPMLTFVLSVIAGFATPFVQPFLTKLIQPRLDEFPVHEGEYRTITFVLLLLGVAISAISSGVMVSAFTVLFGGLLGLFGVRLFHAIRFLIDGSDSDTQDR
jgi:hypothetical protein